MSAPGQAVVNAMEESRNHVVMESRNKMKSGNGLQDACFYREATLTAGPANVTGAPAFDGANQLDWSNYLWTPGSGLSRLGPSFTAADVARFLAAQETNLAALALPQDWRLPCQERDISYRDVPDGPVIDVTSTWGWPGPGGWIPQGVVGLDQGVISGFGCSGWDLSYASCRGTRAQLLYHGPKLLVDYWLGHFQMTKEEDGAGGVRLDVLQEGRLPVVDQYCLYTVPGLGPCWPLAGVSFPNALGDFYKVCGITCDCYLGILGETVDVSLDRLPFQGFRNGNLGKWI